MMLRVLGLVMLSVIAAFSQVPPIEPGVSPELAKWRAAYYSDVSYKLNLTLEKMSPVLKGTIEIRVNVRDTGTGGRGDAAKSEPGAVATGFPIVLDWRRIRGSESLSTISNVSVNGTALKNPVATAPGSDTEHLIFRDGVRLGEDVIKLDFTSPILTSGSAITRYVDKEDGAEYIYSHFAPSDASTAFPVFDQPDLKARFQLTAITPRGWDVISNGLELGGYEGAVKRVPFALTKPMSTYGFAFAAGPFQHVSGTYVRKSQVERFKPHAAEVFRLTREAVKYLEGYFNYKFPFEWYSVVLIPKLRLEAIDGAGVSFLRESSVVLTLKPTKKEIVSRALAIFHATARQWTGEKALSKQLEQQWLRKVLPNLQPEQAHKQIKRQ